MHFLEDILLDLDTDQACPKCSCNWIGKWAGSEGIAYEEWEQHRLESLFPEIDLIEEFELGGRSA
jgi:hypothetical protein